MVSGISWIRVLTIDNDFNLVKLPIERGTDSKGKDEIYIDSNSLNNPIVSGSLRIFKFARLIFCKSGRYPIHSGILVDFLFITNLFFVRFVVFFFIRRELLFMALSIPLIFLSDFLLMRFSILFIIFFIDLSSICFSIRFSVLLYFVSVLSL